MLKKAKLIGKIGLLLFQKKIADQSSDYNRVCNDYDSFFSKEMGEYALDVVRRMNIRPNQRIVELACGTGHITVEIAKQLNGQGSISIIDQSEGMLRIAKEKMSKYKDIISDVDQGDMVEYLKSLPDESVDSIVCGWAICYVNPVELFKEMLRVLKRNGKIGIIETREDSEKLMMDAFETLVTEDTTLLKKYIKLQLPSNKEVLQKWFQKAGFESFECWEGEKELKCEKAEDAIEWIERSGAAAGFMDVMDLTREDEIKIKVKEIIEDKLNSEENCKLSHTFVAGIAVKE